jgi:putative flippase GtrA
MTRWLKFNAVGAIGIGVQMAALVVLKSGLQLDYVVSTALAVEAAIIHNFIWHERFTWRDRVPEKGLARFIRFNLTIGAVSILGNVGLTAFFATIGHLPYWMANLAAIAACSLANFLVSDRVVFQGGPEI